MLVWLGLIVLVAHAFSILTGYVVSGFLYPDARIGLFPDGISKVTVVVDGIALAAIVSGIVIGA